MITITNMETAIFFIFLLAIYLVPSLAAIGRKHKNAGAITALNLLLGWTFVGWVVALVWALTNDTAEVK